MKWFCSLSLVLICLASFPSPAQADIVRLTNRDTLNGKIVDRLGWAVTLNHPTYGRLLLPSVMVDRVKVQSPGTDAESDADEEIDAAEEYPGLDLGPFSLLDGWERHLELGITGSEGNTQTLSLNAGFEGLFENEKKRWYIDSAYFRASEDGDKTRDEAYLEVTRDWLIPDRRYFYFATGRYDFDEFEDWDHRLSAGAGVGYEFVDEEDLELLGRLGVGGRYEIGGSDGDEFTPEGLIGFQARWLITDAQKFTARNTLYPSLGKLGEFRNITKLGYAVEVSQTDNLSVKLSIENEYQSDPDGDAKRNDLKYFASLVWDF